MHFVIKFTSWLFLIEYVH